MAWGVYDYPEPIGQPDSIPHCPICWRECERIYRDRNYEIVGCDECVTVDDAWEVEECLN